MLASPTGAGLRMATLCSAVALGALAAPVHSASAPPAFSWAFETPARGFLSASLFVRCLDSTTVRPVWLRPEMRARTARALSGLRTELETGRFGFRTRYDTCTARQQATFLSHVLARLERDGVLLNGG